MTQEILDLKAVVSLLRRQLRLILATVLLALALAVGYLMVVKPVFTATALVIVDPGQKSLLYAEETQLSVSGENARVESEVEILRSPAVALAVVKDQNLVADPEFGPRLSLADKVRQALGVGAPVSGMALLQGVLDRFTDATTIRRRGLTHVIAVSVRATDPARAAVLTNALAGAYIGAQLDAKVSALIGARDKLQAQIAAAQEALTRSEEAADLYIGRNLERIEVETGRADIAGMRGLLQTMDDDRLAADLRARAAAQALDRADWAVLAGRLGDQALAELQRQREDLERRLRGAEGAAGAVDLRAALAALEEEQARVARRAVGALETEVAALDARLRATRGALRETLLAGELPTQVLSDLYRLQQEATIARDQYQTLLSRVRELEMLAAVQIADSRIVSPALAPLVPGFPDRKLALALALILGAGLGIGLAFLNEFFVGGITSEQQLREVMRLKVATALPLTTPRPESDGAVCDMVVTAPLSPYAESVRRLRASLEQVTARGGGGGGDGAGRRGRCILVTSSNPAEGKSTTALALARAFAASGRSVLLVDADLRKPSLHRLIGIDSGRGLIDYLTEPEAERETAAFLVPDPLSAAILIPGRGRAHRETDQLLGAPVFARLIEAARSEFDVVIVDTPPILPVVDTRYLAPFADAVVMVVRFALTAQRDLRDALQVLSEVVPPEVPVISVLNHEPARQGGYRYRGYYAG